MSKQLTVELVFNANTQQAKTQMQQLQNSVLQVQNSFNQQISMQGLTTELSKAQNSVNALKTNLNSAFDVDTGKLDLNKFNSNLQKSGMTLKDYRVSLQQLGPEGVRAFNQLTQAVLQGQMPLQKTNGLLNSMMNTFGNTLKWSIASGAINKISQGFSNAFQYAKDLNESLNNIRIVTGKSADEMQRFAEKANKAAKTLASTTTAYTDAALIYYQQGLEGKAVEERAETTLKLANVTGQSAEEVSQQLTAVWNNFYDGSKSIEYYADVMTALGAATASSSDEIAQGLEKFAAVADTVGLSYEYATTALATVTAQTRQSADVVGTAFKTLFARIQDLELGETLEDGTTLGKYSESLAKVGVNIKDASGGLKDMDVILDEMGAKWKSIDKDQQVALAKSVAGIRQYTQLIALMDNWDTFEMNLTVAEGAEGTLQEQQDIWAESWDAASKRVKSSAEGIYQSLVNDEFFIDLNNLLADLLGTFDEFLDAIGGLQTLLPMIAGLMLKAFGPAALGAITGFVKGIKGPTTEQQAAASQTRSDILKQQTIMANETGGQVGTVMSQTLPQQKEFLEAIEGINRRLSKSEIERLQYLQAESSELQTQIIAAAELADQLDRENEVLKTEEDMAKLSAKTSEQELLAMKPKNGQDATSIMNTANTTMNNAGEIDKAIAKFNNDSFTDADGNVNLSSANQQLSDLLKMEDFSKYGPEIEELGKQGIKSAADLNKLKGALGKVDATTAAAQKTQERLNKVFPKGSKAIEKYVKGMTEANKAGAKRVANNQKITRSEKNVEQMLDKNKKAMNGYINEAKAMQKVPLGETVINIASGMGQAAAGASMLTNGISSLTEMFQTGEHTLGGWLGALSGIGFAIPMLIGGLKTLTATLGLNNLAQIMSTNSAYAKIMADKAARMELGSLVAAENAESVATMLGISTDQAALVIKKLKSGATLKETLEELGLAGAKGTGAVATGVLTAATWLQTFAMNALNLSMSPVLAIVLVLTAAIAGLVAIFLLASTAIGALTDWYNKDAIAAEQANKQATLMTDKYKTLTEEANKFKEAVTGYKEAQDNLKRLEKGTTEYKEALEEANNKAMELVETYGLWDSMKKDGGVIVIDPDALEKAQAEKDNEVKAAKADMYSAKITANAANIKSDTTDLRRDIGTKFKYNYEVSNHQTGNTRTAVGYRQFTDTEIKEVVDAFNELQNAGELEISALKESLLQHEGLSQELINNIDVIAENQKAFADLAESTREAATANETYAKEIMGYIVDNTDEEKDKLMTMAGGDEELYEQLKNVKTARLNTDVKNSEGQTLQQATEAIDVSEIFSNNELEEHVKGLANLDQGMKDDISDDMSDEKTAQMYAKYILGRDDYDELTYEGGTGIGTLKSVDGTETYIDEGNDEDMRQALARYFSTKNIEAEFDKASEADSKNLDAALEKLTSSGELGKSIIASLQNGAEKADFSQVYGTISSEEEKKELQGLSADELATKLGLSKDDFTALGYANAQEFEKAFDEGIAGWTKEAFEAAQQVKADGIIAQAAEKYELDEEVLKKQTALLRENVKGLEDNAEAAARMAVANQRMNKGVNTLSDNWEDWKKTLKGTDKTTENYAKALVEAEAAMKDILNLSDETVIPEGFLEVPENLDLFEKIADGSEEAVEQLAFNLTKAQITSQEFTSEIADNLNQFFKGNEGDNAGQLFDQIKNNALSAVSEIQNAFSGLDIGQGIKDPAKEQEWVNALNDYAKATGMSAEQMQEFLSSVGVTAQVDMVEGEPVTRKIPITQITRSFPKFTKIEGEDGQTHWGFTQTETSEVIGHKEVSEPTLIPQIQMNPKGEKGSPQKPIFTRVKMGNISPSVTTSGKSSGGSKGGGSGSTSKKEKKQKSDEFDYYHDINREIQRLARTTEELSEAKDRAYGDDKIANLNKEIAAIDDEIDAQERLIKIAEKRMKAEQKALKNDYGLKFDENGEITNYEAVFDKELAAYNKAVEEYNKKAKLKDAGKLSDEEWEKAEEDFEKAEERYDSFSEDIDNYEGTLDTRDDAIETKAAKEREKLDKQLEGIQYIVDVQIEVNDRDLQVLERLLEQLEDDMFDGVDRIKNMTAQMDKQFDNIEIYKAGIRTTLVSAGADQAAVDAYMAGDSSAIQGLDLSEEQMQMLADYTDGIMESEDAIIELREEIEGQTMATFEAWHEEIEKNGRAFEHATSMAESYKNIIDLVGKSRLGIDDAVLKDLEDIQIEASKGALSNAKTQRDTTQNALNTAKGELEKAQQRLAEAKAKGDKDAIKGAQEDIEKWEDDVEAINEQLMEDQEAFMGSWEDALQTAADVFTAQMDRAFEKLEDDLAGTFKSFDELQKSMEQSEAISNRFLDAGEKQYELSKLNRKLMQDLDKTDNIKAQKELLALQKEIEDYQASGVEMSERDLTALQKKYELKLAQIALEDAQNAKSQVRLTRDSQGNFGYVYTADENNVANAQQNYEDKLEENRQLAIEQSKELNEAIVSNRQAMAEALREIRQEDYDDTAAYMAALEEVTRFYTEQEAYLIGEQQKIVERSQEIYLNDYLAYDGWSTNKEGRGALYNETTLANADALYTALQEKQRLADEIQYLKASGQWDLLSEEQRLAYEAELQAATDEWVALTNAQTTAYGTMGENSSGWVTSQSELMKQLGINIFDGVTTGADGTKGSTALQAALGTVDDEESFFGATKSAAETWESDISDIMEAAGVDISKVKTSAGDNLGENGAQQDLVDFKTAMQNAFYGEGGTKDKPKDGSVNGAMKAASAEMASLSSQATSKFSAVASSVTSWQKVYSGKINSSKTDTNKLNSAISSLQHKKIEVIAIVKGQTDVNKLASSIAGLTGKTITITTNYKENHESNNNNGDGSGNSGKPSWDRVMAAYAQINAGKWGNGIGNRRKKGKAAGYTQAEVDAAQTYINYTYPPSQNGQGKTASEAKSLMGYDTGGYTGEWGSEGRLALLHQKEIVLNASDTENLLQAVTMIRDLGKQLENNVLAMKYSQILDGFNASIINNKDKLEQSVTITAEFPNATNHGEIEEAFNNLINLSSQYANRY